MSERLAFLLESALEELAERVARRILELERERGAKAANGDSPWLGIAQAAAYLGWSRQRLYKLTAAGAIPHYKQEGRLLFRRDELERWLAAFAEGPERR
jgi:excisionase family DNA binding protein